MKILVSEEAREDLLAGYRDHPPAKLETVESG